jgi:hypothetical protein
MLNIKPEQHIATAQQVTGLSILESIPNPQSVWYTGESRSGKTQQLVATAVDWLPQMAGRQLLLLAANDENKRSLHDQIAIATTGRYPIRAQTPLGFLQEQVHLFYPWIAAASHSPLAT